MYRWARIADLDQKEHIADDNGLREPSSDPGLHWRLNWLIRHTKSAGSAPLRVTMCPDKLERASLHPGGRCCGSDPLFDPELRRDVITAELEVCEGTARLQELLIAVARAVKPGGRIVIAAEVMPPRPPRHALCDWRTAIAATQLLPEGTGPFDPIPCDPRIDRRWWASEDLLRSADGERPRYSLGLVLRKAYSLSDLRGRTFVVNSPQSARYEFPLAPEIAGDEGFTLQDLGSAYRVQAFDAATLLNELVCLGRVTEREEG